MEPPVVGFRAPEKRVGMPREPFENPKIRTFSGKPKQVHHSVTQEKLSYQKGWMLSSSSGRSVD